MKNLILPICIMLTLTCFSQTGPGGVGNSSNNVIWLNGDIYTLATSPYISSWPDQSGNGNDFSQATATKQPRTVGYAGFKALRFDGGDYITNAGISALNTNTNTHYIVYSGFRPDHVGFLFNASFTENSQYLTAYRSNGNIRSWVLNSSLGIVDNITTNSSTFQIISSVWDGVGQTFDSYKDGTSIGSKSGANGNPTGNYFNIIGASANGSYRFDGDMSELIVYNTAINSAQRTIVDNYLSSKFATTISNDKYSYDATHKYQVIGIGAEADGNNLTAQGAGIVELSAGSLNAGDYIMTGHDNTSLSTNTNDVPGDISGGSRLSRTWRVDITGSTTTADLVFDVSSLTLPTGSYYLLVESVNGIFNDGGVVEYGPFADVAGLVTFSSVSLADGDYYSIASGTNPGIASITTGNWNSASTWNCNCVPTSTDTVTISAGHNVTISGNLIINDLTVNGTLTASAVAISIRNNLVVGVTGNALFKSLIFDGSAAQNFTNLSGSTLSMEVLKVNNGNSLSLFSGNINVTKSLYTTSGQIINVSSTVTLTSNATSTAVLYGSGGYVGQFILQRYISQRNAGWGDLSSPVSNNHIRDWDSNPAATARELYMCGVGGFSGNCGGWNSVYSFDAATQTYPAITDTAYVLTPGTGIELWLADTDSLLYNTTFDSRGTPNYGDVAVPVANSFNLVGNPYQAFVYFNSLTKPTINSTYYIWSTASGTYDAKTAGQIPPQQGFYVESVGAGTLTFTEASKNGNNSSLFYKNAQQEDVEPYTFTEAILKVKNTQLNYAHELKLRINELAKISLDEFDASFLPSRIAEAPSITAFSEKSNKPLAIVSFNPANEVIVPISIKTGVIGQLTIEAISFENFTNLYKYVTLLDTKTNSIYNLKTQKEVTIDLTTEEDDARFELRLSNNAAFTGVGDLNATIYKNQEFTVIEMNDIIDGYTVSIVNLLGQKVVDDFVNITTNRLLIPNSSLPKGVNMISVKDKNNSIVKKLIY
ncbi:MAG: T9SS type A sorting domain-containing protein [Bacteroidetes bacterium]|nr:T9SS type A sorting domain-containing protein [Bacteroidota bacterium]